MPAKCTSTPPSNVCDGAAEAVESAKFVPTITATLPGARFGNEEAGLAAFVIFVMVGGACPKMGLTESKANVRRSKKIKHGKQELLILFSPSTEVVQMGAARS
jgi:hypothetical protein